MHHILGPSHRKRPSGGAAPCSQSFSLNRRFRNDAGSPFDPVSLGGTTYYPGQCNNVFIFPGLGFGSVAVRARMVPDEFLLVAARAVADTVSPSMVAAGRIYPELKVRGPHALPLCTYRPLAQSSRVL